MTHCIDFNFFNFKIVLRTLRWRDCSSVLFIKFLKDAISFLFFSALKDSDHLPQPPLLSLGEGRYPRCKM